MHDWHLAHGFRYAGLHCGVRPGRDRDDLALIVSDLPASAAGVFTQNRVRAAPVRVCQERLPRADARGIIICSGNANACTGEQGMRDARGMAAVTAQAIGCQNDQVLVCSTGVIGRHLPMENVERGCAALAGKLDSGAAALKTAAEAILTTDTRIKVATRRVNIQGADFRLTGFAKGAAMIGPNMATMLAFVCTDAPVSAEDLHSIARRGAASSFNCVRVEGHTSTNDSLILLANGQGNKLDVDGLGRLSLPRQTCVPNWRGRLSPTRRGHRI